MLGLTNDQVHEALGVKHMEEFTAGLDATRKDLGWPASMEAAKARVNQWMGERISEPDGVEELLV